VRGVTIPATVALAAGCGAEISGKSAPAPASAEVIARHMGMPKAPGYVAYTAPTGPNSPLGRHGEYPVRLGFPGPPHTVLRLGCSDAPAEAAPGQAELPEALSREEVSPG
jgi:hypothetical protein